MFKVGQKVVCIDADENSYMHLAPNIFRKDDPWYLEKNKIYTVSSLDFHDLGVATIKLVEVPDRFKFDQGYSRDRFRPVVEGHKGMEVLKSILINPKKKITSDQFDKEVV